MVARELDGNANLRASLPSEIPNRFLLWGIYALPWKMQASPQVEYRNGFPYQPTNVFQQYVESTPGPQFGRRPSTTMLSQRISYYIDWQLEVERFLKPLYTENPQEQRHQSGWSTVGEQ